MEKALFVIDKEDNFKIQKHKIKRINYKTLYKEDFELSQIINKENTDFLMFSRNNMVKDRIDFGNFLHKLKIGYSSFSGIDDDEWEDQTKQCLNDFFTENVKLGIKSSKIKKIEQDSKKTSNLIFDMEQLGGCRYGLPRILKILDRYNVKATFFVTDIVNKTYADVIPTLVKMGHEVGLHGVFHEYLQTMSKDEQTKHILRLKNRFKYDIKGVNFVSRMNNDCLKSFKKNEIRYFIYPHINKMKNISIPCRNLKLKNDNIILIPLCIETYDKTFEQIKNEIIFTESKNKNKSDNITVLMHPFSDGSKSRIENTERVIEYISKDRCSQTISQTMKKNNFKIVKKFNIDIKNKYIKTLYDIFKFGF
ncbi:MAG: polysaccharide deacetylase family protein [Nanohaloarchaea archaeon]|nr:polysaccharide deacetylase family protein [Candidatus Nanohaloarchaea archaeon]